MDLPQLKRRRNLELPNDYDNDWNPTYPPRLPRGRWPDEDASDHRAEVWEEWWDDRLQRQFEETQKLVVAVDDLEYLGSGSEGGSEEEVEHYRIDYMEWEAREVIDLVSISEDLGDFLYQF